MRKSDRYKRALSGFLYLALLISDLVVFVIVRSFYVFIIIIYAIAALAEYDISRIAASNRRPSGLLILAVGYLFLGALFWAMFNNYTPALPSPIEGKPSALLMTMPELPLVSMASIAVAEFLVIRKQLKMTKV